MRLQESTRLLAKTLELLGDTPRPLAMAVRDAARYANATAAVLPMGILLESVCSSDLNNPLQLALSRAISRWDYVEDADWTCGTQRNSGDRRALVYSLLQITKEFAEAYSQRFPPAQVEKPTIIAGNHHEWYPPTTMGTFYWDAYSRYLAENAGWHQDSINVLNDSTTNIIERLSCPWRNEAFQSKGLVVGYVQSGKTANFTGVVAKAVDAGYRLIIILAGVLDVLRNQTQRRVDRELIGKELLALSPGGNEYANDQDWATFIEHGGLPSAFYAPDWHRLTGPDHDYARLGKGVDSLDFERADKTLPLCTIVNLRGARARLMVVKKNPRILSRITDDLKSLHRTRLGGIPALIIDDESDQASIDTSKPDPQDSGQRSATNREIRKLLSLLPRAQYIGYTATPFANVFVNPNDKEDIFPSEFMISLPRPPEYMGVSDFFDMTEPPKPSTPATSNELAFIRSVAGPDDSAHLQAAIESFILAGAIKLFRLEKDPSLKRAFRHHTMLVHSSAYKRVHRAHADAVEHQYKAVTSEPSQFLKRTRKRFEVDFKPVSTARGKVYAFPTRFEELIPYVNECRSRLELGQRVRIVNGDNQDDVPDFDRQAIWSILVGGTKLSRGYTIEGLTVSYYRRRTSTADTLMQMGRWFGFRKGYRDLVRLYLGRSEPLDRKGKRTLDLLEAFKGTCLDEEEFRREIRRYASIKGERRFRPIDVIPLVPSHMLRPTAANKMRHATIKMMNFGGRWSEKTVAPSDTNRIECNQRATESLLRLSDVRHVTLVATVDGSNVTCAFYAGRTTSEPVLNFLRAYQWAEGTFGVIKREMDFISNTTGDADPAIDSWLIMIPQLKSSEGTPWKAAGTEFTVKKRNRIHESGRFKVFSEPEHRKLAGYLCGLNPGTSDDPQTLQWKRERQATLLIYPVRDSHESNISIGFALGFPPNALKTQLRWAVDGPNSRVDAEL